MEGSDRTVAYKALHEHVARTITYLKAQGLSDAEIRAVQGIVRRVPVADSVIDYAVRLVRATRPAEGTAPEGVKKWVGWGAGPRASQSLVLAAKARALLRGQTTPSVEDVRALALPILRHRIVPSFQAEAEGIGTDRILSELIQQIPS